jgi:hypothetical protein
MDDARDESWRGTVTKRLYLPAMPSHMGINVDRLAYPLHQSMSCSCQRRGQGLLLGIILSCRYSDRWHLSGDVKPPVCRYLVELFASMPALLNLTWGKSFLP